MKRFFAFLLVFAVGFVLGFLSDDILGGRLKTTFTNVDSGLSR